MKNDTTYGAARLLRLFEANPSGTQRVSIATLLDWAIQISTLFWARLRAALFVPSAPNRYAHMRCQKGVNQRAQRLQIVAKRRLGSMIAPPSPSHDCTASFFSFFVTSNFFCVERLRTYTVNRQVLKPTSAAPRIRVFFFKGPPANVMDIESCVHRRRLFIGHFLTPV